jgi:pimeloyl-ACP methyl ester carboxylesterase
MVARASVEPCQHGQLVLFDEATHGVHHEHPARVNALLETFLRAGRIG